MIIRRIIGIGVAIVLLMMGAVSAQAAADAPSEWAQGAVEQAIALNLVPERLQSDYTSPITREQFAELIVRTMFARVKADGEERATAYWTPELVLQRVLPDFEFQDAKQQHVMLAFLLGYVNGISPTEYGPERLITRQEAATMLVNASHLTNPVEYTPRHELGYADFGQIADWAKPSVQAAAHLGLMEGVGGRFDYAGSYTREQSIVTMLRLYQLEAGIALRGKVPIDAAYDSFVYNVGRDYVKVSYLDDAAFSPLKQDMYDKWNHHPLTMDKKDDFTMEKAIAIFAFPGLVRPSDFTELFEPTIAGRASKWDFGWMICSIFNWDSVISFHFVPHEGVLNLKDGYRYGYPYQDVSVRPVPVH